MSAGCTSKSRASGARYFRLKYRFGGKEKRLALGVYPETSLRVARERRDEARRLLSARQDPGEVRREEKARAVAAVEGRFDAVAVEWHEKQRQRWTPHHAYQVLNQLQKDIFPDLGARPIAEIEAAELLDVLRKVEGRGTHEMAHRAMQRCGAIFRYGIATGRCRRNPAQDIQGALTPVDKGCMAAVAPREVPELLQKIRAYDGQRTTRIALELLALTFVRTTELIGAEWSEFDLSSREWRIPAERMKMKEPHLVPLSVQAVALLEEIRELTGNTRYVFTHLSTPTRHMSNNTMLYARDMAGG
jgi:integrase